MKYSELYRLLIKDGWQLKKGRGNGGHNKLIHPTKKGPIIIGRHMTQEVPKGTLYAIMKDAGLWP